MTDPHIKANPMSKTMHRPIRHHAAAGLTAAIIII